MRGVLCIDGLGEVVAGISISHHCCCSVCQGDAGRGYTKMQGNLRQTE